VRAKSAVIVFLIALMLAACGLGRAEPTATPIPSETPTPAATLTPTPSSPLAILVLPADMDKAASDLYQKTVYELTQGSGFRFQVRNSLTAADLEPTLKIVIALRPDPGVAALAAAAPGTQFLAIGIPGVTAGGNISTLAGGSQVDIPAFLAGYTAAMISDDYHIGMIIPKDDPDAQRALTAFTNGMTFYCGLCRPFYYLPYTYPQFLEIPSDEDPGRYGGYANYLVGDRKVYTLYIYPSLASPDFLTYVGSTGVQIIGDSMPSPRPGGWVMTIRPDEIKAIQTAWPALAAGQGGTAVPSPLGIADVDPALLTPGKLRLLQQTLDDLVAGRISTGQ
jgi:hypothetical protein